MKRLILFLLLFPSIALAVPPTPTEPPTHAVMVNGASEVVNGIIKFPSGMIFPFNGPWASFGDIRTTNFFTIAARNAANDNEFSILSVAGDVVTIGNADQYITINPGADSNLYFQSATQGMQFDTYGGGTFQFINGPVVLSVLPFTSPSPAPTEGMLKADGTVHHVFYHNGTDFKQLAEVATPTPTSTPTPTPTPTPTSTPILTGTTGSIGGAIIGIGCDTGTATVTGATTSMVAVAEANTYPGDAIFWKARVTNTNEVTVYVCSDVTITPTASTYKVRVIP